LSARNKISHDTLLPVDLLDALGQLGGHGLIEIEGLKNFGAFPVHIRELQVVSVDSRPTGLHQSRSIWGKAALDVTGRIEITNSAGQTHITASGFAMRVFPYSPKYL